MRNEIFAFCRSSIRKHNRVAREDVKKSSQLGEENKLFLSLDAGNSESSAEKKRESFGREMKLRWK
jgi:hypothetical protein